MATIQFEGGAALVTMSWAEIKPYLNGATKTLPYIEVTDVGATKTVQRIVAFQGDVRYICELDASDPDYTEWTSTVKPSAIPYEGEGVVVRDRQGNAISSQLDAGVRRMEIAGKVVVVGAAPPPATNDATIVATNPLVTGAHDTTFTIPNGETFHLQEIIAGNEDPTKGAKVEVIYNNGTEHVIARVYRAGVTLTDGFPNQSRARDGTLLVGDGAHTIIVRRTKFSGSDIAIDAVVRGYTVAT